MIHFERNHEISASMKKNRESNVENMRDPNLSGSKRFWGENEILLKFWNFRILRFPNTFIFQYSGRPEEEKKTELKDSEVMKNLIYPDLSGSKRFRLKIRFY